VFHLHLQTNMSCMPRLPIIPVPTTIGQSTEIRRRIVAFGRLAWLRAQQRRALDNGDYESARNYGRRARRWETRAGLRPSFRYFYDLGLYFL
jgi:hypothetical protein